MYTPNPWNWEHIIWCHCIMKAILKPSDNFNPSPTNGKSSFENQAFLRCFSLSLYIYLRFEGVLEGGTAYFEVCYGTKVTTDSEI